eukprot:c45197_g1_i1 orf=155-337(-)
MELFYLSINDLFLQIAYKKLVIMPKFSIMASVTDIQTHWSSLTILKIENFLAKNQLPGFS